MWARGAKGHTDGSEVSARFDRVGCWTSLCGSQPTTLECDSMHQPDGGSLMLVHHTICATKIRSFFACESVNSRRCPHFCGDVLGTAVCRFNDSSQQGAAERVSQGLSSDRRLGYAVAPGRRRDLDSPVPQGATADSASLHTARGTGGS